MEPIILPLQSDLCPAFLMDEAQCGRKARNLMLLSQKELAVPKWLFLTPAFFEAFLQEEASEFQKLAAKPLKEDSFATQSSILQAIIEKKDFSQNQKDFLLLKLQEYFINIKDLYLAVRPSFAGLPPDSDWSESFFEHFLYLKLDEFFFASLKNCFASAYSPETLKALFKLGLTPAVIKPSIILQEMIFCEVSGSILTANPYASQPDQFVIYSNYGVGAGGKSGKINRDQYIIDESHKIIEKNIALKENMLDFNSAKRSGTTLIQVEKDLQTQETISEERKDSLLNAAIKIERDVFYGVPQEIEWGLRNNRFYFFDSRPVAQLKNLCKLKHKTVFDTGFIQDQISGPAQPLTLSIYDQFYGSAYQQMLQKSGVTKDHQKSLSSVFRGLLAFIHGRVYLNLNHFQQILFSLPLSQATLRKIETSTGIKRVLKSFILPEQNIFRKILGAIPLFLIKNIRFKRQLKLLRKTCQPQIDQINPLIRPYEGKDFLDYSHQELIDLFYQLSGQFTSFMAASMLNQIGVRIYSSLLSSLLKKLFPSVSQESISQLITPASGKISSKPKLEMQKMVTLIETEPSLTQLFNKKSNPEILEHLKTDTHPKTLELQSLISFFLSQYQGLVFDPAFCCKLEKITLGEQPGLLIEALKKLLFRPTLAFSEQEKTHLINRQAAENQLLALGSPWAKKQLKRWILNARQHLEMTQELNFKQAEFFSVLRKIFLALAEHLFQSKILPNKEDIFYLTYPEIFSLIENRFTCPKNLEQIITLRKKEYKAYGTSNISSRLYYYGEIFQQDFIEVATKN